MIYLAWLAFCLLCIGAWLAVQQTVRRDEQRREQGRGDRW